MCRSTEIYATFLCNHAFCSDCLLINAAMSIYRSFVDFQKGRLKISKKFSHKCPEPLCGHTIVVPTHFVRENLRNLKNFSKNIGFFMKYKNELELISGLSDDWIPYFDRFNPVIVYANN